MNIQDTAFNMLMFKNSARLQENTNLQEILQDLHNFCKPR